MYVNLWTMSRVWWQLYVYLNNWCSLKTGTLYWVGEGGGEVAFFFKTGFYFKFLFGRVCKNIAKVDLKNKIKKRDKTRYTTPSLPVLKKKTAWICDSGLTLNKIDNLKKKMKIFSVSTINCIWNKQIKSQTISFDVMMFQE